MPRLVCGAKSKLSIIVEMLQRPSGASIAELAEVTGWRPSSIRGAISGAIRKRRLMPVSSEFIEGRRVYAIRFKAEGDYRHRPV